MAKKPKVELWYSIGTYATVFEAEVYVLLRQLGSIEGSSGSQSDVKTNFGMPPNTI